VSQPNAPAPAPPEVSVSELRAWAEGEAEAHEQHAASLDGKADASERRAGPNAAAQHYRTAAVHHHARAAHFRAVARMCEWREQAEAALRKAHAALRVSVPGSEEGASGEFRVRARLAIEATGVYDQPNDTVASPPSARGAGR